MYNAKRNSELFSNGSSFYGNYYPIAGTFAHLHFSSGFDVLGSGVLVIKQKKIA